MKIVLSLGSRAVCSLFLKMGCSSTLAFVLVLALRATIKGYDAESIQMMATTGSSGADSGNWEKYLNSTPESEGKSRPSPQDLYEAHIQAEDLFEVKVDIIKRMTPLDPEGDWMRRGARALDNPRTATGEESLERLHSILEELNSQGKQSQAFYHLKNKVFRKWDDADRSSAS